jgi:hypothetical protein
LEQEGRHKVAALFYYWQRATHFLFSQTKKSRNAVNAQKNIIKQFLKLSRSVVAPSRGKNNLS